MLVSIEAREGSSLDAAGRRRRSLYCLKCARWTAHAHAGRHRALAIWRCRRCGVLQVHVVAHEIEGQPSAVAGAVSSLLD